MEIIESAKKLFYLFFPFLLRYHKTRQFIKFCMVGSTNTVVDLVFYIIFSKFFLIYYIVSHFLSFTVSVTWSYYWNKRWTFGNHLTDDAKKQYMKFFVINIIGAVIEAFLLYTLVEYFSWNDVLVKAALTVCIAFWNFTLSRLLVFRLHKDL